MSASKLSELAEGLQGEDYLKELAQLDPSFLSEKDSLALDIMADLSQRLVLAEEVIGLLTKERDEARRLVGILVGQVEATLSRLGEA